MRIYSSTKSTLWFTPKGQPKKHTHLRPVTDWGNRQLQWCNPLEQIWDAYIRTFSSAIIFSRTEMIPGDRGPDVVVKCKSRLHLIPMDPDIMKIIILWRMCVDIRTWLYRFSLLFIYSKIVKRFNLTSELLFSAAVEQIELKTSNHQWSWETQCGLSYKICFNSRGLSFLGGGTRAVPLLLCGNRLKLNWSRHR